MEFTDYKITVQRTRPFMWTILVWEARERPEGQPPEWRCIARHEAYNMEGHADTKTRLRVALRGLVG